MPAATQRRRKKVKSAGKDASPERSVFIDLAVSAASGAALGLSAPGFGQWFLAWVGLVPLLLLAVSSSGPAQSFLRGAVFGFAYNLVYLNWYLGLHPLNWLGFNDWQSAALAALAWLIVCLHQALITGGFAALARVIPLTGGFLVAKVEERWHLPTLIVLPLVWVLIHNKLGNAHDLLGVPWSMLEYSQYKQLPLIQIASVVGGIGLGFLLVLSNVAIAGLVATLSARLDWKPLAARSSGDSTRQLLVVALVVAVGLVSGGSTMGTDAKRQPLPVSVLQTNVNIDMQKTEHRYTLKELLARQSKMMDTVTPGLCLLTEGSVPAYLKQESAASAFLADLSRQYRVDLVVGSLDLDTKGHPYNTAFGITRTGKLLPDGYHKRYLVPFGEYTPLLVRYMPEWIQRLTNTPAGSGFAPGKKAVVLPLDCGDVAPLICFETISPELVSASVRKGGQIIVNLSDLAWFHDSMIGEQMIAFSVFRAVENKRYFVFAANSGPSAIIDPTGKIAASSKVDKQVVLTGTAATESEITPFTFWFR